MYVHYLYKITNLVNGRYYIGVRSTNQIPDIDYFGSGTAIGYAKRKYGLENFIKEILMFFDSREELLEAEAIVVSQEIVDDPMCYNLALGGGRTTPVGYKPLSETCQKIQKAGSGVNHPNYGQSLSQLTIDKIGSTLSHGLYITPKGVFTYALAAAKAHNLGVSTIKRRCRLNVDKPILYKGNFPDEPGVILGKTWRELGWSYVSKDKMLQDFWLF